MRISRLAIATLFALWMVAGANAEEPQADAQAASEDSTPASVADDSSAMAGAEAASESPEGEAVDGEPAAFDGTVEEGAGDPAPELPPASPDASDLEASAPPAPEGDSIRTGVGYDAEGNRGHVHLVQRGDTLWDIAETYLTTPWVWPSIWQDNPEVSNPHLI